MGLPRVQEAVPNWWGGPMSSHLEIVKRGSLGRTAVPIHARSGCKVPFSQSRKGYRSLALGKRATQSSPHRGPVAARAVDGNTAGIWRRRSVTHTRLQKDPWWEVVVGGERRAGAMPIANPTLPAPRDCCDP
jgi:hypothetical protein